MSECLRHSVYEAYARDLGDAAKRGDMGPAYWMDNKDALWWLERAEAFTLTSAYTGSKEDKAGHLRSFFLDLFEKYEYVVEHRPAMLEALGDGPRGIHYEQTEENDDAYLEMISMHNLPNGHELHGEAAAFLKYCYAAILETPGFFNDRSGTALEVAAFEGARLHVWRKRYGDFFRAICRRGLEKARAKNGTCTVDLTEGSENFGADFLSGWFISKAALTGIVLETMILERKIPKELKALTNGDDSKTSKDEQEAMEERWRQITPAEGTNVVPMMAEGMERMRIQMKCASNVNYSFEEARWNHYCATTACYLQKVAAVVPGEQGKGVMSA